MVELERQLVHIIAEPEHVRQLLLQGKAFTEPLLL